MLGRPAMTPGSSGQHHPGCPCLGTQTGQIPILPACGYDNVSNAQTTRGVHSKPTGPFTVPAVTYSCFLQDMRKLVSTVHQMFCQNRPLSYDVIIALILSRDTPVQRAAGTGRIWRWTCHLGCHCMPQRCHAARGCCTRRPPHCQPAAA